MRDHDYGERIGGLIRRAATATSIKRTRQEDTERGDKNGSRLEQQSLFVERLAAHLHPHIDEVFD